MSRHFLWPGQEAHEGVVWRTGSSAELLQLHSSRIERNVPQILHPLPAFQSPEVPSSLGWIYNCDLFWTLHRKLRFFFLCWLLSSQEYSAIFWSQYGSWRDHGNQLSKWTFNWSFTREKGVKAVQHNVDPLWHNFLHHGPLHSVSKPGILFWLHDLDSQGLKSKLWILLNTSASSDICYHKDEMKGSGWAGIHWTTVYRVFI